MFARVSIHAKSGVRGLVRRAVLAYPAASLALAIAAAAVRLSCRDRWPVLSTLFYATPPVVPAALLAAGATMWRLRGRRRAAAGAFAAAALLAAWFVAASWRTPPAASGEGPGVRLLFWNVGWGQMVWDRLASECGDVSADVLVLVETGVPGQEEFGDRAAAFPEHEVATPGGGIRALVRGRIESSDLTRIEGGGRLAHFVIATRGRRLDVLLCDLASNPLRSRGPAFEAIRARLEAPASAPRVLLGDFNTPPDSVHFDPIRRSWRRAFEAAGDGYDATWPVPVPLLPLDQVWVGPEIGVSRCRHLWSLRSDHRAVLADLEVPAN